MATVASRPAYRTDVPPVGTPQVAIWLPRVSAKPNRVRIQAPTTRGLQQWLRGVCGPGTQVNVELGTNGKRVWTVSRAHFDKVVTAFTKWYGQVLVIQDYTERVTCTAACQFATSDQSMCECSCLGLAHGAQGAVTKTTWTDGSIYVYNEFTRRCWIATDPPKPETPTSTQASVTFGQLTRMLANEREDPRQWRKNTRTTVIS